MKLPNRNLKKKICLKNVFIRIKKTKFLRKNMLKETFGHIKKMSLINLAKQIICRQTGKIHRICIYIR